MKSKFTHLRESMNIEFKWLQNQFTVNYFKEINLKIYNTGSEQSSSWGEEKNGYLMYDIDEPDEGCDILLFLNSQLILDEMDRHILKEYQIDDGYDLYYFMLYHEFGHLLDIQHTFTKHGYDGMYEKLEGYERERKEIEKLWDEEKINESEAQERYRKLAFENSADLFAFDIYHKRIEFIREYIKKMEG